MSVVELHMSQRRDRILEAARRIIGRRGVEGLTMRDLADADLEEQIVRTFLHRLDRLDAETRESLAAGADTVRIVTANELGPSVRDQLMEAVGKSVAPGIDVEFEQSSELVCGIRLSCGDQRLAWNLDSYMDEFSDRIGEHLRPGQAAEEAG